MQFLTPILNIFQIQMPCIYFQKRNKISASLEFYFWLHPHIPSDAWKIAPLNLLYIRCNGCHHYTKGCKHKTCQNTFKRPPSLKLWRPKAETGGFEPSIRFPVYTLSRRASSTTRAGLRRGRKNRDKVLPVIHLFFYHSFRYRFINWAGPPVGVIFYKPGNPETTAKPH